MDEASDVVAEELQLESRTSIRQRIRDRTPSLNSPSQSKLNIPPKHRSTLRGQASSSSIKSVGLETDRSEIVAPIPRRHLLQASQSLHWLRLDTSEEEWLDRRATPVSPVSSVGSVFPNSRAGHRLSSFSTVMERERNTVGASSMFDAMTPVDDPGSYGAGRRWVRWMHRHNMKDWVVPSAIAASTLVKWCIGLGSYSGHGTPPTFGDYEAQRHWMELTIHLPVSEWYTYDLQYWGLDYPPLTAYISWLCGKIGSSFEPSWFALETSRGIETPGSKLFMRSSVLVLDLLVYVLALYTFVLAWQGRRSSRKRHAALLTLLFHPALLLIDFGHFQYNSVMLGLTVLAMNAFAAGHDLLGAIMFVLSLGFKQMSLYYAPAVGSYLIGKCIYLGPVYGTRLFLRLALTTTLAFIILFAPFLPPLSPLSTIAAPITRIFPFGRGLFEDKVANFWCFTNVLVLKWKRIFAGRESVLIKASTGLTALGFLPAVAALIFGGYKTRLQMTNKVNGSDSKLPTIPPTPVPFLPLLPYALLTCSISFFLFSFQVHEKTILVPLLPLTLLLSGVAPADEIFSWGALGNNVGVFSMWPLLKKDGLGLQYVAMLLIWNRLIGHNPFKLHYKSFVALVSSAVYIAIIIVHLLELMVAPPARYPDLFPVLNVLISTPVFVLIWLWSIKRSIEVSWAITGLPGNRGKMERVPSSTPVTPSKPAFRRSPPVETMRADLGVRAVSLGHTSGYGRAQADARRRALEVLKESVDRDR